MRPVGSRTPHSGTTTRFGCRWDWIHWIKPDGGVVIVATKAKPDGNHPPEVVEEGGDNSNAS